MRATPCSSERGRLIQKRVLERHRRYNRQIMSADELEIEVLKLAPHNRARLAEKLLQSMENLSDEENAMLWAEEAKRRDQVGCRPNDGPSRR